jgi:GMP synthase-like glutamine amidotransferase
MKFLVLQHEACEPLGYFEEIVEYEYSRLYEGDFPKSLRGYSSLIIMGGPMNVYQEQEYPFLKDENLLIKEALREGLPTLGICLGSQLIAKAAGAKVYPGREKEIGWYKVRLTEGGKRDRLFSMFEDRFTVFQWHGDTFDLPEGAVLLAENDLYNQAFRIGNAYGLQFHLEVTEEMISDWIRVYKEEVQSLNIDTDKILEDTKRDICALNQCAKEFITRFLTLGN